MNESPKGPGESRSTGASLLDSGTRGRSFRCRDAGVEREAVLLGELEGLIEVRERLLRVAVRVCATHEERGLAQGDRITKGLRPMVRLDCPTPSLVHLARHQLGEHLHALE